MNLNAASASFVFISNMSDAAWGGSEELWAGAALQLAREGQKVAASVHGWSPLHRRVKELAEAGVKIQERQPRHSLAQRVWQKLVSPNEQLPDVEGGRFITRNSPSLVVLSCTPFWLSMMEKCAANDIPFVTVSQANLEGLWPDDHTARICRRLLKRARRCYFVSNANKHLLENQIGCALSNAEVVWNPFKVDRNVSLSWPELGEREQLKLASVARLHPPSKGQDILLEALADPNWRSRNWHLTLYGEGPMRETISRMITRLGLDDHVTIAGYVESIETVWRENHALMMPSRYEGLPLAMVEAMLCARPVLATDVADHAEIVIEGVTGFLADATTPRSVELALERLWSDRFRLREMGEAAKSLIRSKLPSDPIRVFADKLLQQTAADYDLREGCCSLPDSR